MKITPGPPCQQLSSDVILEIVGSGGFQIIKMGDEDNDEEEGEENEADGVLGNRKKQDEDNEVKEKLTTILSKTTVRGESREDGFIELYKFLQCHTDINIYSFAKDNMRWKDNVSKNGITLDEFISGMLEWAREAIEEDEEYENQLYRVLEQQRAEEEFDQEYSSSVCPPCENTVVMSPDVHRRGPVVGLSQSINICHGSGLELGRIFQRSSDELSNSRGDVVD